MPPKLSGQRAMPSDFKPSAKGDGKAESNALSDLAKYGSMGADKNLSGGKSTSRDEANGTVDYIKKSGRG